MDLVEKGNLIDLGRDMGKKGSAPRRAIGEERKDGEIDVEEASSLNTYTIQRMKKAMHNLEGEIAEILHDDENKVISTKTRGEPRRAIEEERKDGEIDVEVASSRNTYTIQRMKKVMHNLEVEIAEILDEDDIIAISAKTRVGSTETFTDDDIEQLEKGYKRRLTSNLGTKIPLSTHNATACSRDAATAVNLEDSNSEIMSLKREIDRMKRVIHDQDIAIGEQSTSIKKLRSLVLDSNTTNHIPRKKARRQKPSRCCGGAGKQKFDTKCPYFTPEDNIIFTNRVGVLKRVYYRIMQFSQRKFMEWGGRQSCNPLVRILGAPLFWFDALYGGLLNAAYFLEMKEIFGPNFVHAGALCISKFDPEAKAKDSIDAKLITYPQRKSERIGTFSVKHDRMPYYGESDRKGRRKRLVPLFVSDPGATQDPNLPTDQPDHTVIRNLIEDNFLGENQIPAIVARQTDPIGSKLLRDFGENVQFLADEKEIIKVVEPFLQKFLTYCLFDVDIDEMPKDVEKVIASICSNTFFAQLWFPLRVLGQKQYTKDVHRFVEYIMTESKVLMNTKDGSNELGKEELCKIIPMIFGVAAFVGTRDLATRSMCRMPKGYAAKVANNSQKLRNAILEVARLHTPVTFASQIVDDEEGLTTQIGGRTFTFKKGTPVVTSFDASNKDEKRFPNPCVFDPENRDFSLLSSFNSIGEKSYEPSPRICPGREIAIAAASNMIRAKVEAEGRRAYINESSKVEGAPPTALLDNSLESELTIPLFRYGFRSFDRGLSSLPLGIKLHGGEKLRLDGLKGKGVKVAVIDSGVAADHPGFGGQVVKKIWLRSGGSLMQNDHGTHVAGTIHMMAPEAKIYDYRVFGPRGMNARQAIVTAIDEAIDEGCDIINMSFGGPAPNESIYNAVRRAHRAGVVLIAAAGNEGDNNVLTNERSYPAYYRQCINVGAIAKKDNLPIASFSNSNSQVDYCGIGVKVVSFQPDGTFQEMTGTSMATPHVCGLITALMTKGGLYSGMIKDDKSCRALLNDKCVIDIGTKGKDNATGLGFLTYLGKDDFEKEFLDLPDLE